MSITNPKFAGRSLLLKIGNSNVPSSATFATIGAVRTSALAINQQEIDITDKDDDAWKKLLEGGVRDMQITFSGLVSAEAGFETLISKSFAGNMWAFQIIYGDGDNIKGLFQITAFSLDGDYKDAQKFTCTLKSGDTPAFTNV